jgi:hypothetical protein
MHLLKFKSNEKKEDNTDDNPSKEKIAEKTPKEYKKKPSSSNIEEKRITSGVESQKEDQIIQESEPDIPSSKELITAFEEITAYIYQLEFNRNKKYDFKKK